MKNSLKFLFKKCDIDLKTPIVINLVIGLIYRSFVDFKLQTFKIDFFYQFR